MKRIGGIITVILVSILPFIIIFATPLLPHTSDGGVHLPRMGAYYKALVDGHIPVRWAGDLNYGYGLPLFNFMYQTPYLIASFFIVMGASLVFSFKLTLAMSFVLSGVFMYLFAKEWLGDKRSALWLTMFYQFAPFRLVEILVRGAIGGIYSYTFLPLALWGITRTAKKQTPQNIALTASATALLIISHNSLSLIYTGVIVLFVFWFQSRRTRVWSAIGLAWGLTIASFYWMPALLEHKYTYGDLFMKDLYRQHFPPLINFFLPNLTNMQSLRTAEISVQLGIFHVLSFFIALVGVFKGWFDAFTKKIVLFATILLATSLFLMQPASLPLWEHISFLRQFQFPWRFLALASFATTLLSVALLKSIRSTRILYCIALFTVISTAYYWYPTQGFDQPKEQEYWQYPLNTTYFGETDVIWSAGPAKAFPKSRVEFVEGSGVVTDFAKKTQLHTFTVETTASSKLVDHTQYFPGWRVYVDGVKTPVEFQDQNWRGEITFPVPEGRHQVRVVFEESRSRFIADVLSGVAIVTLVGFLTVKKRL